MSSGNPETRSRILSAAWELLETARGGEVRMKDIAEKAGVSRQAVYLHFPTRTDLLVATTHHIDKVKKADERLARSRAAKSGTERLDAFIEAWGNYIPEVYGVAKALMVMSDADEAAKRAWEGRLQAIRAGCQAAIDALDRDGLLSARYSSTEATDLLTALLSVATWEHLTSGCGWSQDRYVDQMKALARQAFVRDSCAG